MPLTVDVPQALSNLAPNMRPQGRSGLEQYGGQIYDEWLLDLRGTRAAKVYQEMRDNDATVGALLYAIESLVLQAPRSFEPADDSDEAIAWADLIEDCSQDMAHTFDEFVVEVLSMLPQVRVSPAAHALEHSLEVHLPFLQTVLEKLSVVPLAVGEATADEIAQVLDARDRAHKGVVN